MLLFSNVSVTFSPALYCVLSVRRRTESLRAVALAAGESPEADPGAPERQPASPTNGGGGEGCEMPVVESHDFSENGSGARHVWQDAFPNEEP